MYSTPKTNYEEQNIKLRQISKKSSLVDPKFWIWQNKQHEVLEYLSTRVFTKL